VQITSLNTIRLRITSLCVRCICSQSLAPHPSPHLSCEGVFLPPGPVLRVLIHEPRDV
jgi:hypothetical protein